VERCCLRFRERERERDLLATHSFSLFLSLRYAWMDLNAGPIEYGPASNGEGMALSCTPTPAHSALIRGNRVRLPVACAEQVRSHPNRCDCGSRRVHGRCRRRSRHPQNCSLIAYTYPISLSLYLSLFSFPRPLADTLDASLSVCVEADDEISRVPPVCAGNGVSHQGGSRRHRLAVQL
jgi:hypothetical protein